MRDLLKFYRLSDVIFYARINTIYQFDKPFLDKKNVYFGGYGAFYLLVNTSLGFIPISSIPISSTILTFFPFCLLTYSYFVY